MTRRYVVTDGEWVRPTPRFTLMCCDCSLVHRVELRVVKGCILLRMSRHTRSTRAARKARARTK